MVFQSQLSIGLSVTESSIIFSFPRRLHDSAGFGLGRAYSRGIAGRKLNKSAQSLQSWMSKHAHAAFLTSSKVAVLGLRQAHHEQSLPAAFSSGPTSAKSWTLHGRDQQAPKCRRPGTRPRGMSQ